MSPVTPRLLKIGSTVAVSLVLLLSTSFAWGQTAPEAGRFTLGFEQRVRSDDWNNAIDMTGQTNDQRDQLRDRSRLWMKLPVTSLIEVQVGANMENTQRVGMPKRFDEIFFDQANITFKKVFVPGLALKIGRQDIMRGEGFVIFDGTPGDGPRSTYFNAVDLSYSKGSSSLEFIGILDPARDRFLPRWHDQRRVLQTWDEQALGTYFTTKHFALTTVEAYYFLKKEVRDILPRTNPQFQPDRHVSTAGGRVTRKLAVRTDWAFEYARQWGAQHGGKSLAGWGAYSWVKHTLNQPLKPYLKVGYWWMSNGWNPLFSQWPKWSDMYVYTQSKEVGIGYWTNLRMSQFEAGFVPVRKTSMALIWYHMDSFQPFAGDPHIFGSGTGRGENFQARLEYSPNPLWKAHLHFESHRPGDFYAATRSSAYEVQAQVTYQIVLHPLDKQQH